MTYHSPVQPIRSIHAAVCEYFYSNKTSRRLIKILVPKDFVVDYVCNIFGVSFDELESPNRSRRLVKARQTLTCLILEYTEMSLSEIGRMMNRDHSTIIHLRDKMTHDLTHDENLKEKYNKLKSLIEGNEKTSIHSPQKTNNKNNYPNPNKLISYTKTNTATTENSKEASMQGYRQERKHFAQPLLCAGRLISTKFNLKTYVNYNQRKRN